MSRIVKPPRGSRLKRTHQLGDMSAGWLMNEFQGSVAYDVTGGIAHAVFSSSPAPTWEDDHLVFGADEGQLVCADSPSIQTGTSDFSVVIRAMASLADNRTDYIGRYDVSDGWRVGQTATGTGLWYAQIEANNTTLHTMYGSQPVPNQWQDIVLTADRDGYAKLYVDTVAIPAEFVDISATAADDITGESPFRIGKVQFYASTRKMAFAYFYKRVLTADEVAWIYREPFCMFQHPTPKWAFFDLGADATILIDRLLSASAGEYTISGIAVSALYSRIFNAEPGTFTLTGADAEFMIEKIMNAAAGSYSLSGADLTILKNWVARADAGAYTLTGADITVTVSGGLPTGVVSVTFSVKAPGVAFSVKAPGVAFSVKAPGITFTN